MRKSLLFSFAAVMFFAFAICVGHTSAIDVMNPDGSFRKMTLEEWQRQWDLKYNLDYAIPWIYSGYNLEGVTDEKLAELEKKVREIYQPKKEALLEKFGDLRELPHDQLEAWAEALITWRLEAEETHTGSFSRGKCRAIGDSCFPMERHSRRDVVCRTPRAAAFNRGAKGKSGEDHQKILPQASRGQLFPGYDRKRLGG